MLNKPHEKNSAVVCASRKNHMQDVVRKVLEVNGDKLLNDLRPMVRYQCSAPQESEEVARDIYVQAADIALEKCDSYQPAQNFRLWFLGIARMCLKKRFSSYERRNVSLDSATDFWETMVHAQTGDIADPIINSAWVVDLMERLSPEDQQILTLSIIDQLASEEIGQQLKISPGTARMRLCRALERARKRAEEMDRISTIGGR
jgi:RNA polymerase sigma factor (sigma-70 family)